MTPAVLAMNLVFTVVPGQQDSLFAGRRCDRHLLNLQIVTLQQVGDSAPLADALRDAADERRHLTAVAITYRGGLVSQVRAHNSRSRSAGIALDSTVRNIVRPLPGYPDNFHLVIARRNTDGLLRLFQGTVTCGPRFEPATDAAEFIRRAYGERPPPGRETRIEFWLEPTGEISDVWIEETSGLPMLDQLALQAFDRFHYAPPLVGRTPVGALMMQPFKY